MSENVDPARQVPPEGVGVPQLYRPVAGLTDVSYDQLTLHLVLPQGRHQRAVGRGGGLADKVGVRPFVESDPPAIDVWPCLSTVACQFIQRKRDARR